MDPGASSGGDPDTVIDLQTLVRGASKLEALPVSATRLAEVLAQEDWHPSQVVQVVSHDQALTGKLLRVANSVFSGSHTHISTVDTAVLRLGTGVLLSLAIGSGFRRQANVKLPEYDLPQGELWRHSVRALTAMEEIVRVLPGGLPPEANTAALMHDVGKLLLARHVEAAHVAAIRDLQAGGMSLSEAELEVLGVHHGEIGALVAEHWNLPELLVRGIHHHHDPAGAPYVTGRAAIVCHAVHFADVMAHAAADGKNIDLITHRRTLEVIGISAAQVPEILTRTRDRFAEVLLWYQ